MTRNSHFCSVEFARAGCNRSAGHLMPNPRERRLTPGTVLGRHAGGWRRRTAAMLQYGLAGRLAGPVSCVFFAKLVGAGQASRIYPSPAPLVAGSDRARNPAGRERQRTAKQHAQSKRIREPHRADITGEGGELRPSEPAGGKWRISWQARGKATEEDAGLGRRVNATSRIALQAVRACHAKYCVQQCPRARLFEGCGKVTTTPARSCTRRTAI